jgi:hypothetical protein
MDGESNLEQELKLLPTRNKKSRKIRRHGLLRSHGFYLTINQQIYLTSPV